jgi:large subunit ribosomal protein L10
MPRPEKVQAVKEIGARFKESSAALFTEYRGLTVTEIAELRRALREANTEYKVLKNTLARIAAKEVGLEELVGLLQGPTAVAFVQGDAVEAAKALDDAAKKFPVLVIKGGVLDGRIVSAEQAQQLAKLESREMQLTKIVLMVNTPLQQTANVLSALLRDFGSMLAQVVAQKESEAPAPETPAEAPAEAPVAEAPAAEASADTTEPEAADQPAAETGTPPEAQVDAPADETPEAGEAATEETPEASETEPQAAEVTDGGDPAEAEADDDQSDPAEK